MCAIFAMSSQELPPTFVEAPDKALHAGAYFLMALLAVRALGKGLLRPASPAAFWGGLAIAWLYGASDEWHQASVPGRHASFGDFGADTAGVVLAASALLLFWRLSAGSSKRFPRAILDRREIPHD